jgi:polysaccharide export outer membrane protein
MRNCEPIHTLGQKYSTVSDRLSAPERTAVRPPDRAHPQVSNPEMNRITFLFATLLTGPSFVVSASAADAVMPPSSQAESPAPATNDLSNSYIIGPGDTIQVFVWRNPELTTTVPVRPDGKVSTPLVEDMTAVGKTPSMLARDIEKVLAEYVRSPQVNVIVTQPVSSFSQVKVIGQVTNPQSLAFREGMTVLDAILAAGGLGTFASGNRAKIIRTENGKQREIKIKLDNIVNKGDLATNLAMKPGDVLVVPETAF